MSLVDRPMISNNQMLSPTSPYSVEYSRAVSPRVHDTRPQKNFSTLITSE